VSGKLLFSSIVDLMSLAVCNIRPSLHAAYQAHKEEIKLSAKSVYNKVNGVETQVSAALVRETAVKFGAIVDAMPLEHESLIPGYVVKLIDGNHLPASEHRIKELRSIASGPLPGHSLVVIDPARKMVVDVFPCEDGHQQERSVLLDVVEDITAGEVWIGDRNFCTTMFLWELDLQQAFYVIRQHATNVRWEECGGRRQVGRVETGLVYEQVVTLHDGEGNTLSARRITIQLDKPTESGESEIHLLSNLPEEVDALTIARAYRQRWTIENVFWELAAILESEVETLGYPKAALFAFCVALLSYNVLRVVQCALAAVHGQEKIEREFSSFYLADEISGTWRGMEIAIPDIYWERYVPMSPKELASYLMRLAAKVKLSAFKKHRRGPKKPPPKRASAKGKPHVSTAKLLLKRTQT
jgi:IS4 transposase